MKRIILKNKLLIGIIIGFFLGIFYLKTRSGVSFLTGQNKDTLTSTKRNQLLNKFDTAIGRSGPDSLTAGSGDKLTTTKWNALVDKVNTYSNTTTCTNNNNGNCNINVATKSALEPNLLAGNIKSGISIFGVAGTMSAGYQNFRCTNCPSLTAAIGSSTSLAGCYGNSGVC